MSYLEYLVELNKQEKNFQGNMDSLTSQSIPVNQLGNASNFEDFENSSLRSLNGNRKAIDDLCIENSDSFTRNAGMSNDKDSRDSVTCVDTVTDVTAPMGVIDSSDILGRGDHTKSISALENEEILQHIRINATAESLAGSSLRELKDNLLGIRNMHSLSYTGNSLSPSSNAGTSTEKNTLGSCVEMSSITDGTSVDVRNSAQENDNTKYISALENEKIFQHTRLNATDESLEGSSLRELKGNLLGIRNMHSLLYTGNSLSPSSNAGTSTEKNTLGSCVEMSSITDETSVDVRNSVQENVNSKFSGPLENNMMSEFTDSRGETLRLSSEIKKECTEEEPLPVFTGIVSCDNEESTYRIQNDPDPNTDNEREDSGRPDNDPLDPLNPSVAGIMSFSKNHSSPFHEIFRTDTQNKLFGDISSNSEKKFLCRVCGKSFSSKSSLLRHEDIHSGEKNFPCNVCGKEFSRKYNQIAHSRIHTAEKNFKCDLCGKGFYWKSCLSRHMGVHTGEKDYKCPICGKIFFNKSYVAGHMVVHTKKKLFICEICGKGFSFSVSLRKHRARHNNIKDFKCDICGKEFYQKSNLKLHREVHVGARKFKCDYCGKDFVSKTYLANHIAIHTGEKKFSCEICEEVFSLKAALKKHWVVHGFEEDPFNCDICGEEFCLESNLKLHQAVHNIAEAFKCHYCEQMFHSKAELSSHIAVHSSEFKCEICGKTFLTSLDLESHKSVHIVTKEVFKCSLCSKVFNKKHSLNLHMVVHTGQKNFSCEICGRSYYHKLSLYQHMALHTGKNKCNVCGKVFARKCHLRQHILKHASLMDPETGETTPPFASDDVLTGHQSINTLPYVPTSIWEDKSADSDIKSMISLSTITKESKDKDYDFDESYQEKSKNEKSENQDMLLRLCPEMSVNPVSDPDIDCTKVASVVEPMVVLSEPQNSFESTCSPKVDELITPVIREPCATQLSKPGTAATNEQNFSDVAIKVENTVYIKEECDEW